MDKVKIQVLFSKADPDTGLSFTDALYFTQSEYDALSKQDIEDQKQARFDAWKANIEAAKNAPPLSKEEQIAELELSIRMREEELAREKAQKEELEGGK